MENEELNKKVISYSKKDLIVMPELIKAVVIQLESKKAKDVYGEKAKKSDQEIITIHYENVELKFKGNTTINHYPINGVPYKSKLGKIINKYDGLCVGTIISLLQSKEGYFNIILE